MNQLALHFVPLLIALAQGALASAQATDRWTALLATYVVDERWVDYEAWHAHPDDRAELTALIETWGEVDPRVLTPAQAKAYWINLYNAATVELVLEHYPLASIKDIDTGLFGSPWKLERVAVGARTLSLDAIEHEILRREFDDPRIHFALNCASVGCPPLADEAFIAERLDAQLDAASARAVGSNEWVDPSGCAGSYGSGRIAVTKIFDWFADDFGGEAGIRDFLARHRPSDSFVLRNSGCALDYLDYDWTLNAPPQQRH